jgi:ABC-type Co2+ transport system permease subunit
MDRKPTIPLYVGLFALAYILLAILIGYVITWFRVESSPRVNEFVIAVAACITTYWFTRRENRHFTKQERFEIIFGSITADITIQVSIAFLITSNLDFSNKWVLFLLILASHAMLIVLSYSLLKKMPLPNKAA